MQVKKPTILWKRGAVWLAFLGPFFFLSYGWLNHVTSLRNDVGVIVEAWEHSIPFVPWLMLPYMSIDAFYATSLFLFRKKSMLDRHALRLLLATVISLIGFLLYPLQFSFAVPKAEGFNGMLQAVLLGFDKPYNQAPSLHISLLMVLWVLYAKKLTGLWRLALHGWFSAIAVSVLLVYQHHFVDIWTGAIVGVACLYLIPDTPFAWRWQPTTACAKNIGLRYAFGSGLLLVAGLLLSEASGFLSLACFWVAISLLLVAAAYFGFGQQIFQRNRLKPNKGQMHWPALFLLAPYLFGSWLSYRFYTKNRQIPNQIHPKLWLGAFPRSNDSHTYSKFNAVLDLTNEFATPSIKVPFAKYLPVMDLTAPSPQTLVKACHWLGFAMQKGDVQNGQVLVHCALGLSRSASVVVCWLVWRGHTVDTLAAIAHVNKQRPGLVLSPEHMANIEQALQQLRENDNTN
jgi:protein-tyrosine phosphatase/membrane-associated phospholipid phosphatase